MIRWINRNGLPGIGKQATPPANSLSEQTGTHFDRQAGRSVQNAGASFSPGLSELIRKFLYHVVNPVKAFASGWAISRVDSDSGNRRNNLNHGQPDSNGADADQAMQVFAQSDVAGDQCYTEMRAVEGGALDHSSKSQLRGRGDLDLEWLSCDHRYMIARRGRRLDAGDLSSKT